MEDDDKDFCYHCNEVTTWTGQICKNCGRVWGYDDLFY